MNIESCMNDLEQNIINRIKSGDSNAFEQIVDKYKDKGLTLSMRILKNKEDAEDSLQEAFMKTFRAIADNQFEQRSKFSTYFYRIVYNTALDNYKKHKSRTYNVLKIDDSWKNDEGDDSDLAGFETKIDDNRYFNSAVYKTDKRALDNEIQTVVNKFLEVIPEKYSVILTLFYINDLSHDEISDTLKIPIGTVKNRIYRAKEKLKEIMMKKFDYESILEFI
ncbi:MAG: sigma-70 family RNA polymerase sigma factor [Ignavibacteriae bacterium]|nr:MAG: sigma-70 family RNA polymerase sigma factor [Ignavibacteriota bacterium]